MKSKKPIYYIAFVYVLLLSIIFCGCQNKKTSQNIRQEEIGEYTIVVIDSCEYIERYKGHYWGFNFSHKGNCKFCAKRNR